MKINARLLHAFSVFLLATLLLMGPLAYAQDALEAVEAPDALEAVEASDALEAVEASDAPQWVRIDELKWAGSGCPVGSESVALHVARNRDALRLEFSSLRAATGPGVSILERRKNCSLIVRLSFPRGWSFTIFDATYRGHASLDHLVESTQRSAYAFQGDSDAVLQTTLVGSVDKRYAVHDTLGLREVEWSPCGKERALIIRTEVRAQNLRNNAGSGLISLKTAQLGLKWRRCH